MKTQAVESTSKRVQNKLRTLLIEQRLEPGARLVEAQLCSELGVSRTPIREAIHILEQQGLVLIVPKSGTFVAEVDPAEVQDSLYTRIALEELALRQSIERSNPEEWEDLCEKLRSLLKRMKEAVEKGNTIAATELDIEWHTTLIDAAQNRSLSRVWRATGLQFLIWSPERNIYPLANGKLSDITYIRHKELFDVIQRKDPDECSQAIGRHIQQRIRGVVLNG
jgi:DNA-binding GntR family transcriptional regulator